MFESPGASKWRASVPSQLDKRVCVHSFPCVSCFDRFEPDLIVCFVACRNTLRALGRRKAGRAAHGGERAVGVVIARKFLHASLEPFLCRRSFVEDKTPLAVPFASLIQRAKIISSKPFRQSFGFRSFLSHLRRLGILRKAMAPRRESLGRAEVLALGPLSKMSSHRPRRRNDKHSQFSAMRLARGVLTTQTPRDQAPASPRPRPRKASGGPRAPRSSLLPSNLLRTRRRAKRNRPPRRKGARRRRVEASAATTTRAAARKKRMRTTTVRGSARRPRKPPTGRRARPLGLARSNRNRAESPSPG